MKNENKPINFKEYLEKQGIEDMNDFRKMVGDMLIDGFFENSELTEETATTADDFLDLAENASTKKDALKYAKKALELDSENIDAEMMVADISATSVDAMIKKYQKIIDKATKTMKEQGYFEDCMGEFWLVVETRPYMRLLHKYAILLMNCAKLRLAMAECERMLDLCVNDNLGTRYALMHIYAYFEDEKSALKLCKKYDEESTQFLLPLSILYYRLGNLTEATKYLKKLKAANKDTSKFFNAMRKGELMDYLCAVDPFAYEPDTLEEFIAQVDEFGFLFISSPSYFEWGYQKLKSIKN